MIPWKTSLVVALVSGLLTVAGLHHFQQRSVREARTLRSQNNRMRAQAQQRTPLVAAQVPAPSVPANAAAPVASVASSVQPVASYYRNEGNASPLATLQTFAWAGDRGDVALVGKLLYLDPAARTKSEAYWASLPEGSRQEWKTMDDMAAAILTKSVMVRPFPDAEILATATVEPINAERVRLRLPGVPRDRTEYQKTADGWKYVVTEAAVDAYLRQAANPR